MFERMRTGLRELPSNAAWLVSQAVEPVHAVGDVAAGGRHRRRKVTAAVVDAAPLGDSVQIRARRAHEAAERAREAEERALEAARTSKELAEHARALSERGRARIEENDREMTRKVARLVAEAQKAADEFVMREQRAAEADAEEQRQELEEEVEDEIEAAESDAEAAQWRAEELVEHATAALEEARRLAEEVAEAARSAAENTNRQAEQLQNEARQRASDAEAHLKTVEDLRKRAAATGGTRAARELDRETMNGGLDAYKKPELVELAASIGIERRTTMTKNELVDAIMKAARRAGQGVPS